MPRLSHASLRGYLLEDCLAYLIRSSGYSLLVDKSQDPEALEKRGNGLVVKGRGAEHQVDVLGELDWTPAFSFPLRLFLEAKFRGGKTGISAVRNAVGVLSDLNQRYSSTTRGQLIRRFRYAYTLFSTSGFTEPAVKMAFAHEVSLVDLSGTDYDGLRTAITSTVERILGPSGQDDDTEDVQLELPSESTGQLVRTVRRLIREQLGTYPIDSNDSPIGQPSLSEGLAGLVNATKEIGDLFVGMAAGPYMLAIRANNRTAFLERMLKNPVMAVGIHWSTNDNTGRRWLLRPADSESDIELTFNIPEEIGDWIFSVEGGSRTRALRFKQVMLPHIFIPFKDEAGRNHLFRLDYDESQMRFT